jgi:hypothetical protein
MNSPITTSCITTVLKKQIVFRANRLIRYFESVKNPSNGDLDEEIRLKTIYDSKPSFVKETFAYQYATQFFEQ